MKYIIAIGNMIRCDDGIGAHIIEYILKNNLENGFHALDFATNIWGILPLLNSSTEKILIIDCALMQEKPGTAKIFPIDCIIKKNEITIENHEASLIQLLELAKTAEYSIPNISVMGIEPNNVKYDLALSNILENNLIDYAQYAIDFIQTR